MIDQAKVTRLDCSIVGRKRRPVRPPQGSRKTNYVELAVKSVPGRGPAVARICGVSKQAVYDWIKEWRVDSLVDALKLARATGYSVERLAGPDIDFTEADKVRIEVEAARAGAITPMPKTKRGVEG